MSSETSFTIEHGQTAFSLFHTKKANCVIDVIIESSFEVGAPQNVDGGWVVPCDVVGLGSKKTKNVKIRFHPSVEQLCRSNKTIHETACRDSLAYLDDLLDGSEWTRHDASARERYASQLDHVASGLLIAVTHADFETNRLVISWPWKQNPTSSNLSEARETLSSKAMSHYLFCRVFSDENGTSAVLSFEKDDFSRDFLKVFIDSDYLLETEKTIANIEITKTLTSWVLPRKQSDVDRVPPVVPNQFNYFVMVNSQAREVKTKSAYALLSALRQKLDDSLASLSMSLSQKKQPRRVLSIVRNSQDANDIMVEVTPIGETPQLGRLLSQKPLNVDLGVLSSCCDPSLASSPAESIDSGVSLSPTSSPTGSPFTRERSYSESVWSQHGLKGILKQPRRWDRFARSVSLCHEDEKCVRACLTRSPTFDGSEDDLAEVDETEAQPLSTRQKRVSFSEKVDKRLFNSRQSIESQKKKNQKRKDQKKRKEERDRCTSGEGSGDETSAKEDHDHDSVFEEDSDEGTKCGKATRQDSGFSEEEDGRVDAFWQKAVQRVRAAQHN